MSTKQLDDPQLAGVLNRYYQSTFGGPTDYAKVESLRFEGILHFPEASLPFTAYKKKPDYCKITLSLPNNAQYIMAYDGTDAWQLISAQSPLPVDMPAEEALNFIRDASFGGRLVYPVLPGKQINLTKVLDENELAGYELEVVLPAGQTLRYFIDAQEHLERRQTIINMVTGVEEVITFSDYREVAGIKVPFRSVSHAEGVLLYEAEVVSVVPNAGIMPWMFTRPTSSNF